MKKLIVLFVLLLTYNHLTKSQQSWWTSTQYYNSGSYLWGRAISSTGVIQSKGKTVGNYNSVRYINDTVDDGLVAYYPFNGNAIDETGNGNNGNIEGAIITSDRFENDSSAFRFDGSNNKIVVNDFSMPYSFTIALWVKCDSTTGSRVIFSKNYDILIKSQGNLYQCVFRTSNKYIRLGESERNNLINTNQSRFDFLVMKYDLHTVSFYVNNALVGSVKADGEMSYDNFPTLIFGGKDDHFEFYSDFSGILDDIRIYNRPLSSSEQDQLYFDGDYPSPAPVISLRSVNVITQTSARTSSYLEYSGRSPVVKKGICWSTLANPDTSGNKIFNNDAINGFNINLTGLNLNTRYYLRAFAINNDGVEYSNEIAFTTLPEIHYGSLADIEGNRYKTIRIGAHTWMAENLKTTKYSDGSPVPMITDDLEWGNLSSGAYCWYNNDTINRNNYGGLYNYYTITDNRHICPLNWHIPTDEEWSTLPTCSNNCCFSFNGGTEFRCMIKEPGSEHWLTNPNGTNETGFTVLPGGVRQGLDYSEINPLGRFLVIGYYAFFWEASGEEYSLSSNSLIAYREWHFSHTPKNGYSIRCVEDDPQVIIKSQQINQNSFFEIPVFIYNLPVDQVISYQFDLIYEGDLMQFKEYDVRGSLSSAGNIQVNPSENKLSVAWAGQTSLADSGILIKLRFKAIERDTAKPMLSNFLINTDTVKNITNGRIEIIPAYGDVDANENIQAYDAALALQHSVGLNPLPDTDPLPWENWRFNITDVDRDSDITAYDASLILEYTVGLIDSLPVAEEKRAGALEASVDANIENGYIVFRPHGEFNGLKIEVDGNFESFGEPQFLNIDALTAVNITSEIFALGMASAYPMDENSTILKIPIISNIDEPIIFNLRVDKIKKRIEINLPTTNYELSEKSLEIYPNPANKLLYIKNLESASTVGIYDMQGRIIKSAIITDKVDISDLENGIYMIQINCNRNVIFKKIIKQ